MSDNNDRPLKQGSQRSLAQKHQKALLNNLDVYLWSIDAHFKLVLTNSSMKGFLEKYTSIKFYEGEDFRKLLREISLYTYTQWQEHFQKVTPQKPSCKFEYNELLRGHFVHMNAAIEALVENGKIVGYNCKLEENTEQFLVNRLNELKSKFKGEVIQVDTVNELLWRVTDSILSELYLEDAVILKKEGRYLRIVTAHGAKRKGTREVIDDLGLSIDRGITGYVATHAKPVMVNDTDIAPLYFSIHFEGRSEVAVPIIVKDEVFGIINCESSYSYFFGDIHLQLLQEVAEVTANRIEQIMDHEDLKSLKMRHQSILDSTPDLYFLFDKDLVLQNFNRAARKGFENSLGYTLKPGISFEQVIPQSRHNAFVQNAERARKEGEPVKAEFSFTHPEEGERWFFITYASAQDEEGEPYGLTMLMKDITGQKRNENEVLRKNRVLKKANQELDKFVYSVSHDLRAPLSSIMGLHELLTMARNMEEVQKYNTMIGETAQQMDGFIRKILEYSRNSRSKVVPEKVYLPELIEKVLSKIQYMKGFKNVRIKRELAKKSVFADPYRLEIILHNLLSNAVKYQDAQKEECLIEIKSATNSQGYFNLEVEDNGTGVAQEHLPRLFDMFYSANSHKGGPGIGLYIMKDAVEALEGTVDVKAEPGKGAKFMVTVPEGIKKEDHEVFTY